MWTFIERPSFVCVCVCVCVCVTRYALAAPSHTLANSLHPDRAGTITVKSVRL